MKFERGEKKQRKKRRKKKFYVMSIYFLIKII
jgi:hypothetical protein